MYMLIGPRKIVLIGAIAAVAIIIVFYPLIVLTPFDPERVTIELTEVDLLSGSEGEQSLDLRVALNITNTSDFTLTTSKIEYDLFASDDPFAGDDLLFTGDDPFAGYTLVESNILSYEDVPVTGRPIFFENEPVTITDTMTLQYSDEMAELFNKILNNSTDINWRISGVATIESGTTLQERAFSGEV